MRTSKFEAKPMLTVQQFAEAFFPTLIKQISTKAEIALRDAIHIGEIVVDKLKSRFRANKPRPIHVFQQAIAIIATRETTKYKRLTEKNFGLSEEAFAEMTNKLQAGDESLFEQVFLTHFKSCVALLKKKYRASHQDAYDATMNAMLAFCRNLKAGKIEYGNLRYLFTQMATHNYLKWIQRQSKTEEFSQLEMIEELPRFDKESYELLGQAFAKLGDGCRDLLNAFYYNENTLQQISEKTNRSYVAIRKQKQRCIEKLRDFFTALN